MKRLLLAVTFLLTTVLSAEAATITIVTTPEQDAALISLRRTLNVGREVKLTAAEFKDYIVSQWLDSLVSKAGEDTRVTVREGWEKADQVTKDQVKTLLKVQ